MRRKHPPRGYPDASWDDVGDPHGMTFAAPRLPRVPIQSVQAPAESAPTASLQAPSAAALQADAAAGGCADCRYCSRFGNCGDPVAAGLSDAFRLIAHPEGGRGCPAYAPADAQGTASYWRLHLPDGVVDLAVCPPASAQAMQQRHPSALRIEPIAFAQAWPAG